MNDPSNHFEDLVTKLIYQHCHSKSKERCAVVEGYITNGLDADDASEVIGAAVEELDFVQTDGRYVWYIQNEDMVLFVKNHTDHDLGIIGVEFSHLTPPWLRDEYDIPTPRH